MKKIIETKTNFNELIKPLRLGQIIDGKIIGSGRSSIFLDLGPFGTGIIYGKEFHEVRDTLKEMKIGDKFSTKIINLENEEGYIELSLKRALKELDWGDLEEKKDKREIIKVKILGANRGGLLTKVSEIPGFLPVSQLSSENYPKVEEGDANEILRELKKFIGKRMEVRIFDISSKEQKLILSEKIIESEKIKEILKEYEEGDVVEGKVTGIVDFGVFVKFSNTKGEEQDLEGLIHISELDWKLIENPSQILKVDQKIKVKIIKINEDKIFLSLKELKKNPWKGIDKKYKKEDKVSGKVVKFNPFGAFIEITPEIQGLVHVSEFGTQIKMEEKLEIGKKYNFQISEIDPEKYRMILKLIEK